MKTHPMHDRAANVRLVAEARTQRAQELRAAAHQALDAFRWKEFAVLGVVCLAVASVAGCSG